MRVVCHHTLCRCAASDCGPAVQVIPTSALEGDNVVERSERTPWYEGPPLLEHLDALDVAADRPTGRGHKVGSH